VVITWDERKRLSNLDKHGLDFAAVTLEFLDRATIVPTKLGRRLAIGKLGDDIVTVVIAWLGNEAVSVISMRPANSKERVYAP
jgi:uncharacterized DUF497 family protein